jgi:hypothetical protein
MIFTVFSGFILLPTFILGFVFQIAAMGFGAGREVAEELFDKYSGKDWL